jgi:hypothetical protein
MTPTPRTSVACTLAFCTSSVIFAAGMLAQSVPRPTAPDFAGTWTLVSSTTSGSARGGTGGGAEVKVKTSLASGAPVNCGTECTMTQTDKTLTISRVDPPGVWRPDIGVVVLNLDGSESVITHPSGSRYAAKAKVEGGTLVVTRDAADASVTQSLSIEDGKLKVVTRFAAADGPVTLTYVKK